MNYETNGASHLHTGNSYPTIGAHRLDPAVSSEGDKYQTTGSFYTKEPLNVDTPTKFVTYSLMSCIAVYYMHFLFHWAGLDI